MEQGGASARADEDTAAKLATQKKKAQANWEAVAAGPAATLETKHLLIYAPKTMQARLKAVVAVLEKYHGKPFPAKVEATLLEPVIMIHRFYRLAEALALRLGRDPDRPRNLRKVTETL